MDGATIYDAALFELLRAMRGGGAGPRLHLCRLSSAAGVALLRQAKAQGLNVTADVSIHSLLLTDADIGYFDSSARLIPPLRQQADRDALAAAHALPAQLPALEAAALQQLAARGWQPDYLTVRRRADLLPPSYRTLTLEQRQQFEKLVSDCINGWNDWLKGWDGWKYDHVDVKIVGWAVLDKSVLQDQIGRAHV